MTGWFSGPPPFTGTAPDRTGRRRAGRALRAARARPEAAPAGHFFEPDTVTWRVHADPLLGLAALRSLLLRALHPAAAAANGVPAGGADEPWHRLGRTMQDIGVMTFGSTVEAMMAAARSRALLAQADADTGLLLWEHCCQVASFLDVLRRGGLDLPDADQERYLREQVRAAALLGLEPEGVPASRAALTQYFRKVRPELRAAPAARALAGAVVGSRLPEVMNLVDRDRPVWAPVAGLAFAALPAWARKLYDMPFRTGPAALAPAATTVALHSLRASLLDRPSEPSPAR